MRIPKLKTDKDYANRLQLLLATVENVSNIRMSPSAASVVISYIPNISETEFATTVMKTIEGASLSG